MHEQGCREPDIGRSRGEVWSGRPWVRRLRLGACIGLLACLGQASSSTPPTIMTVAGGGAVQGDGGPAIAAQLEYPVDVAVDAHGNLFVADRYRGRVRKVNAAGTISTVAGNGSSGYNGDGIAATSASIAPTGVAVDAHGNLYITEGVRIRKVSPNGIISTVVGSGTRGFAGDGGLATSASISSPLDPEVDAQGNLYFIDSGNRRIRKVDPQGVITTVAGSGGWSSFFEDGALALDTGLEAKGLGIGPGGDLLMVAGFDYRVIRLAPEGTLWTMAGGGFFATDPMARNVNLQGAFDVAADARGNVYVSQGALVMMVTPDGAIHHVAGTWNNRDGYGDTQVGYGGDGGPAVQALLKDAMGIAVTADGYVVIADSGNARVRRITPVAQPERPPGMFALLPGTTRYPAVEIGAVVIGDFDGDGRDDVAYTGKPGLYDDQQWGGGMVCIQLQLSAGAIDDGRCINMPAATPPARPSSTFRGVGLTVVDMDGDGVSDLLVGGPGGIGIVRGSRARDFRATQFSNAWNMPVDELVVTDVDGNGVPDVVARTVEAPGSQTIGLGIYTGTRSGLAQGFRFVPLPFDVAGLRAVDVDGDGRDDLVMGYQEAGGGAAGGAAVLHHDGGAGFLPARMYPIAGSGRASVAVGDFNADGRRDLAVARVGYQTGTLIHMFHQDAYGHLQPAAPLEATLQPAALLAVDLDRDALDDLLVLNVVHWSLGYHQNRYGRGLGPQVRYEALPTETVDVNTLAVGDLNHDGHLDVIKGSGNRLVTLLGTGRRWATRVNGSQPLLPPGHAAVHGTFPQPLAALLPAAPSPPVAGAPGSGGERDAWIPRADAGRWLHALPQRLAWRTRVAKVAEGWAVQLAAWWDRRLSLFDAPADEQRTPAVAAAAMAPAMVAVRDTARGEVDATLRTVAVPASYALNRCDRLR